jgi:hypothetical protein
MLLHEEQSGRFLCRPKQDYPAATVAEFCTAVLTRLWVKSDHLAEPPVIPVKG